MDYIDIDTLEQGLKALNCLDTAMTSPEEDWLRCITCGEDEDMRWYMINNGGGDELMVLFSKIGILLKGFDHENDLNQFAADEWDTEFFDKMFAGIPDDLLKLLTDDERDNTTFCMWYIYKTGKWYQNEYEGDDGGKEYLLGYIPDSVEKFIEWGTDYFEENFNKDVMEKIFATGELSDEDKEKLVV